MKTDPHPRDHPKYSGPLASYFARERAFYDSVGWDVKPLIEQHDDEFVQPKKKKRKRAKRQQTS